MNRSCKHFTGVQNNKCKLGIPYDSFAGKLPCVSPPNKDQGVCEKREFHTPEEIKLMDAERKEHMSRFMLAVPVINRIKKEHKGVSWKGEVECPVCKGKLHVTHAAYNGHVWGKCETKDCLSWME